MQKQESQTDVLGEVASPDWGEITAVARVSTRTIRWKSFGYFQTNARPLQLEIESSGTRRVVAIPDVQNQIIGALSVAFAAAVLLMTLLRRLR